MHGGLLSFVTYLNAMPRPPGLSLRLAAMLWPSTDTLLKGRPLFCLDFSRDGKMPEQSIVIFDDEDLLVGEKRPLFSAIDFGGVIPHAGDLIALPAIELGDETADHLRLREVVERYFWPSSDFKTPTRVGLLVRERRPRKPQGRKAVANTRNVAKASTASDIPFIIQQIYTCLRTAKSSKDEAITAALLRLADAFADRAISLGADPATIPRGSQREQTR